MSEASAGVDCETRPITLAVFFGCWGGGGVRKEVEPTGMLPNDKLVVLKRKEKKL